MFVKGIIMFLGMNNTRLERKILMILDIENGFLPTYLPQWTPPKENDTDPVKIARILLPTVIQEEIRRFSSKFQVSHRDTISTALGAASSR